MKYTKEEIIQIVEDEDVEFIRLQFTDIFGMLKNVAITASQLPRALENKCKFEGSAIDGFDSAQADDLYLYPDLDTFEIFPWRPQQGKVARLLCDVCLQNGEPFTGDSRYVLKHALEEARELGYTFVVGPELEFFLFHRDDTGAPTVVTHEKAGYFDLSPIDLGENARRDMVLTLEDMNFEIEASHHEASPGQHEIDFKYDTALNTADKIMTFKLAVKSIAIRHGLHASFMPKPKMNQDGSGMHINMSLFKDGKNIFADEKDANGLSKEAYQFIAGILEHVKGMSLITNPLVNSYKRFVPGFDAPVYIAWSFKNRNQLIRVSAERGEETHIELRNPDPSANPYLVLAGCIKAGLDGIKRGLTPPAPVTGNVAEQADSLGIETLPGNLHEAIREFEKDSFIQEVIGDTIFESYSKEKRKEWMEYRTQVTDWEIERYLYRI
jgi:glutamine synthetase